MSSNNNIYNLRVTKQAQLSTYHVPKEEPIWLQEAQWTLDTNDMQWIMQFNASHNAHPPGEAYWDVQEWLAPKKAIK
jgi:hypothetical protein